MKDYWRQREQLITTALEMGHVGLNQGTDGNLSVRVEEGFLLTPSGMSYALCRPEHIVLMGLDGKVKQAAIDGYLPSSEWRFHRDVYQNRSDAAAVLHAHSDWCTTLACLGRDIPAFHYMVAVAGGNSIRCSPYATFGTQALSDQALIALEGRRACLLGNHGLLCMHHDLERVLALAVEVEHLARVYCQSLSLGMPHIIDDEEMVKVVEKFKTYGQHKE